jgi:hypothetical protein
MELIDNLNSPYKNPNLNCLELDFLFDGYT